MCSANVSALAARKRSKQARRWWVRPSLRSREVAVHTGRLLPDLRSHDEEYFRDFMRMPPRTFDTLLELLRPAISKQDTNHRPTISAHDCLAMSIRYAKEVRDKLAHYFVTDGQVPLAGQSGAQQLRRTR
ncbi:uncharacterized protein LOC142774997 [Rhipicephalus microplus]|uniref:uncharacterized protein LOC142774997 n=1 Tax=Rhipicephalus microplus TaxID=6941 RepID=UPI003F6BE71B